MFSSGALLCRAGGELAHRGHLGPRVPRLLPPGGGHEPDQLVIRQAGQARAVLARRHFHDGAQHRSWCHVRGRAGLGELIRVEVPGGQTQEQALPGPDTVLGPGAVRFLVVVLAWMGERVLAHMPPPFGRRSETPRIPIVALIAAKMPNYELFFVEI
jgi:hypothetical protein